MDKEQYIAYLWDILEEWLDAVDSGQVQANIYIKQAIKRFKRDLLREDLFFDNEKVNKVFTFFWYLRINKDNHYQQFIPLPFQIFIVLNIFGFYWKESKKRRYRYAYLFTGRKSGKTTFAAALQLYGLVADGVVDPQSLLLANSREQASIALSYMIGIIGKSPSLRKRLETQRYLIRFKDRTRGGYSKILASNATRLDGYSPNMVLIDEVHAMQNHDIFNVLKSGTLARENPLIIIISTAGFSTSSLAFDLFETGKKTLNGDISDDSFFYALFTLDDGDDWKDPDCWIKANPSLGETMDIDDLLIEFNQSKNLPTQLNNFLTKNLNIFTNEGEQWIAEEVLKKCFEEDIDWNRFKGHRCYAGIDLSSTRDLTALSLTFREEDGIYTKTIFFAAKNPSKRIRKNGIDILPWIREGLIVESQTSTVDYDLLFKVIAKLKEEYNIEILYYDKFNSAMLIPRLQSELGIVCEGFDQTARRFNEPLKYLEKMIYDGKWKAGKNGALLWNFRNVVLYIDGNGNIKILKNKSQDSVDGCVSTAMSIGALIAIENIKLDLSAYS
jgi:phage terminase large subunit-like protein